MMICIASQLYIAHDMHVYTVLLGPNIIMIDTYGDNSQSLYSMCFNLCVKNLSHVEGTTADTTEMPLCDRTNAATV